MKIRLGTRRSQLALAQAQIVINELKKHYSNINVEIVEIVTTGDKLYNANLALIGGKGLFLKEIEEQLLLGNIDIAVHSMKDVPAEIPSELVINCVLKRGDARDAFISTKYSSIADLPRNAIVGTSSSRRKEQLLIMRPDLNVIPFRGNVPTRIEKVKKGEVDACLLALAGLERINLEYEAEMILSVKEMIPAVCQGIICIESRKIDKEIELLLSVINHKVTEIAAITERSFMKELSGNCTTPLAAFAEIEKDRINLSCGYFDKISQNFLTAELQGTIDEAENLGYQGAKKIKNLMQDFSN